MSNKDIFEAAYCSLNSEVILNYGSSGSNKDNKENSNNNTDYKNITTNLVDNLLKSCFRRNCTDNISAVFIGFKNIYKLISESTPILNTTNITNTNTSNIEKHIKKFNSLVDEKIYLYTFKEENSYGNNLSTIGGNNNTKFIKSSKSLTNLNLNFNTNSNMNTLMNTNINNIPSNKLITNNPITCTSKRYMDNKVINETLEPESSIKSSNKKKNFVGRDNSNSNNNANNKMNTNQFNLKDLKELKDHKEFSKEGIINTSSNNNTTNNNYRIKFTKNAEKNMNIFFNNKK